MIEAIGIAGTGRMGTAFCKRLIDTGRQVAVWNRTEARTATCAQAGATVASSPAALASDCGTIITSLTDAAAARDVYEGPDGLLRAAQNKLFIEMSTFLPSEQKALAAKVREAGGTMVECPVGGTVGPALKGQLLGVAGGAEEDFERARPLLEDLCKRVERVGDVGAGAAMKLAVNLPLVLYWQTLGEALHMLDGLDIDGATVASILADSSAGPTVLKNRMDIVAKTIDGADQPGPFDINGLYKDLRLALRWAEANGHAMPMSSAAAQSYEAARAQGFGGSDGATLARFVAAS
ncbi:MAG: NAD(P)-dependent oxidoreductase [Pseudomonadota bacterium]